MNIQPPPQRLRSALSSIVRKYKGIRGYSVSSKLCLDLASTLSGLTIEEALGALSWLVRQSRVSCLFVFDKDEDESIRYVPLPLDLSKWGRWDYAVLSNGQVCLNWQSPRRG